RRESGHFMSAGERHDEHLLGDLSSAQRHIIRRPRLTELLDLTQARAIVLTAPAGYGKTTLAREWLGLRGRRGLWCRATTGAADIAVVARSLAQALSPISPTIQRSVRELLAAMHTPENDPGAIAELLSDEIRRWPDKTWLVVDEYEHLSPYPASVDLI